MDLLQQWQLYNYDGQNKKLKLNYLNDVNMCYLMYLIQFSILRLAYQQVTSIPSSLLLLLTSLQQHSSILRCTGWAATFPPDGVFNSSREYLFSVLPCSLLSLYISHLLLLYLKKRINIITTTITTMPLLVTNVSQVTLKNLHFINKNLVLIL